MTDAPLERMQKIADFRTTCRFLRRNGKHAIGYGLFILFFGAQRFQERFEDCCYLGVGVVEFLVGLRNRFQPTATGLILDGISAILLGAWLAAQQLMIIDQGGDPSVFGCVFGFILLAVGFQRFRKFGHVRDAFQDPPTQEQIDWFDDIIAEIQEANAHHSADMIEFTSGFVWKGKRLGDVLILVDKLDLENLIVDPKDFEFIDKAKALFGGCRVGQLRVGERVFRNASIKPEMIAILESWRADADDAESPQEDQS